MPMTTTGMKEAIDRFLNADARMKATLEPVVADAVQTIETDAQSRAYSPGIAAQAFTTSAFLSGTVGFHERGYPHAGEVRAFEGDGVAPEPFHPLVYGGPGTSDAMTHPALGPATEDERPKFDLAVEAAVREALS